MSVVAQRLREIELERTLPPQHRERGPRFSPTAAIRLLDALNGVYFAEPQHTSVPEPGTLAAAEVDPFRDLTPLDQLDVDARGLARGRAYCAYVRVLITTQGVAAACGWGTRRSWQMLNELQHEGSIVPVARHRTGPAAFRLVWEWVGEGA